MLGLGTGINKLSAAEAAAIAGRLPGFTGLLDETFGATAEAAYSVRQLSASQSVAMTIRRDSDNAETDIGFDSNGNLDEAAIETFCTGTVCKVSSWADQSGNGNDATQSTAANQPTIYTGGALVKLDGHVALDFSSGNDYFVLSSAITEGSYNLFTLHKSPSSTSYLIDANTGSRTYLIRYNSKTWQDNLQGETKYVNGSIPQAGLNDIKEQNSIVSATNQTSDINVLFARFTASDNYVGLFCELLIYTDSRISQRTSIEENIGDYFTQNTPLLDTYSGAAAAYSLRKLRSDYSGNAVKVRRASDNVEADIGFNVFKELDTVALAAHCGSSDGFVSVWYDQSSSNNATQTTAANQPKIYDGTTGVVTENGKPAVEFDNSNDSFADVTGLTYNTNDVGAFVVCRATSGHQTYATALNLGPASGSEIAIAYRTERFSYCGTEQGTGNSDLTQNLVSLYADNASNDVKGYIDQTQKLSTTTVSNSKTSFEIGNLRGIGATYWGGTIQEIVFYASSSKADHTNIESNINTFYNIY